MRVLFIHRSVGHHLLKYGNLRRLLNDKKITLDDYDNNNGLLTHNDATTVNNAIQMPGNNTNPDNLVDYFGSWPNILNDYDLIMVKSCYPNSHIKDDSQLNKIKENYTSIFKAFSGHNKQLLILTTPPLRPLFTNQNEAKLSSDLADWLVSSAQPNIHIFDMHHLYSEQDGKYQGMLKRGYRRLLLWDNHPNRKAHKVASPQIAKLLASINTQ